MAEEQNRHVRHRLERYGAGQRRGGRSADLPGLASRASVNVWPHSEKGAFEVIAAAVAEEIERVPRYRPVATDGARRAAELIAPLV